MAVERVGLVAKRQKELHGGKPDYFVYAGSQLVGRIYQTHMTGSSENWFWGVNSLTVDVTVGAVMHGHASDLLDAKAKLRTAFNRWIEWAEAMPRDDLKNPNQSKGRNIRDAPVPALVG